MINVINQSFTFSCFKCERVKKIDLTKKYFRVKIKCTCGNIATIELNFRKNQRVDIEPILGKLTFEDGKVYDVKITQVSLDSMRLSFYYNEREINLDELCEVCYTLNDKQQTIITEKVIIKRVIDEDEFAVKVYDIFPYSTQQKRKYFWILTMIKPEVKEIFLDNG